MSTLVSESLRLTMPDGGAVSGLWTLPFEPRAALVLAHGAGAGMQHPFLAAVAEGLANRSVAVLRYQFPYMESGAKRVDSPAVAQAAVRAACAEAAGRFEGATVVAGGKSFGGRMTSQAEAAAPLPGIAGLAFLGFPLHPAGKPSNERARHLEQVGKPMLFMQGTRDALASIELIEPVVAGLGARSRLVLIDGADHGFHVLVRSGRTDAQVLAELLDVLAGWIVELPGPSRPPTTLATVPT